MVPRLKARQSGLATIEMAMVLPLLMLLTLGVIEYGWMFLKSQQITNAARQGARAGALAVFAWAIVRLVRPQFQQHRGRGVALAIATLVTTLTLPLPQFVVLLMAGGLGAAFLRSEP